MCVYFVGVHLQACPIAQPIVDKKYRHKYISYAGMIFGTIDGKKNQEYIIPE